MFSEKFVDVIQTVNFFGVNLFIPSFYLNICKIYHYSSFFFIFGNLCFIFVIFCWYLIQRGNFWLCWFFYWLKTFIEILLLSLLFPFFLKVRFDFFLASCNRHLNNWLFSPYSFFNTSIKVKCFPLFSAFIVSFEKSAVSQSEFGRCFDEAIGCFWWPPVSNFAPLGDPNLCWFFCFLAATFDNGRALVLSLWLVLHLSGAQKSGGGSGWPFSSA